MILKSVEMGKKLRVCLSCLACPVRWSPWKKRARATEDSTVASATVSASPKDKVTDTSHFNVIDHVA